MQTLENLDKLVATLYQEGLSGREITERVQCSLKAVYQILRRSGIKSRSSAERNSLTFLKKPHTFSLKTPLSLKETILMNAALMLYCGEGAKTGNTVDFANSNPDAVKLFVKFLREIYNIDNSKLRVYLYCYSSQNSEKIKQFWSKCLDIPLSQFTKPYISPKNTGGRILERGVVHVRYNDKRLLESILTLCEDKLREMLV